MKHATRLMRGIGAATAVVVAGASSVLAAAAAAAWAAAPRPEVLATVNGVAVPQAALDAALATAGRLDTRVQRREFKQRLIACELLRQAARKSERRRVGEAPRTSLTVSPHGALVCSAEEIRPYVLNAVRPAAVTEAEVHARYAALARAGALPATDRAQVRYAQVAGSLRARIEAERLDTAIRAFADRLIEQADIEQ